MVHARAGEMGAIGDSAVGLDEGCVEEVRHFELMIRGSVFVGLVL